jgi:hypothetical protein
MLQNGQFSMNRMTFSFKRFSLTPALSHKERENCRPMVWNDGRPFRFMVPIHVLKEAFR